MWEYRHKEQSWESPLAQEQLCQVAGMAEKLLFCGELCHFYHESRIGQTPNKEQRVSAEQRYSARHAALTSEEIAETEPT